MAKIIINDRVHQEVPDPLFADLIQQVGDPDLASAVVKAGFDPAYRRQMVQAVQSGAWPQTMLPALSKFMGSMPGGGQAAPEPAAPMQPAPAAAPAPAPVTPLAQLMQPAPGIGRPTPANPAAGQQGQPTWAQRQASMGGMAMR